MFLCGCRAYADYGDMMDTVEQLVVSAIRDLRGGTDSHSHGNSDSDSDADALVVNYQGTHAVT